MNCLHCNIEIDQKEKFYVSTSGKRLNEGKVELSNDNYCSYVCLYLYLCDEMIASPFCEVLTDNSWKPIIKQLHDHIEERVNELRQL